MKKSKLFSAIVGLLTAMLLFTLCACSPQGGGDADSLEITKMPNKTEYSIGDTLDLSGGEVTATFANGTTSTVPLTADGVEISDVNMNKAGKKSITVNYMGGRARLEVVVNPFIITFDTDGKANIAPVEVAEIAPITNMPNDPVADGLEFGGWFTNAEYSNPFEPGTEIKESMTLYARWLSANATYYTVIFDNNFYGSGEDVTLQVEENSPASKPRDPRRTGYEFVGWFTEADGGQEYDFNTAVTESTTVYAHWNLTTSGTNEYVFEAENLDLKGKSGLGYSGAAQNSEMVMYSANVGASNDYFVGYTYSKGLSLEFRIASDRAVDDAVIVARLSGEMASLSLTPDMFTIELNGEAIDYGRIDISGVPNSGIRNFDDYQLCVNAHLNEGENTITFIVNNDVNWIGGGTVGATAPLFDCVKVTTEAVLCWNGEYGLPVRNY